MGFIEVDLVCVERTQSRKPYHRLALPIGVDEQEADAPGRMYCGRPKSVNRVINDELSK